MIEWIKTDERLPDTSIIVLGFWDRRTIESVTYSDIGRWNVSGYRYSEYRNPPKYWAEIPNLPIGFDK